MMRASYKWMLVGAAALLAVVGANCSIQSNPGMDEPERVMLSLAQSGSGDTVLLQVSWAGLDSNALLLVILKPGPDDDNDDLPVGQADHLTVTTPIALRRVSTATGSETLEMSRRAALAPTRRLSILQVIAVNEMQVDVGSNSGVKGSPLDSTRTARGADVADKFSSICLNDEPSPVFPTCDRHRIKGPTTGFIECQINLADTFATITTSLSKKPQ